MYRDGDTLVLERKNCPACTFGDPEFYGKIAMNARGDQSTCERCGGDWEEIEDENLCDTIPLEIVEEIPMRVYRNPERAQSMNEGLLGFGCLWSSTDYGRHQKLTDDELIEKVRETMRQHLAGIQACKIVDEDTLEFPDHIGIFTNSRGYSVRAVHNEPEDVEEQIAGEREYYDGLALGSRLAEAGLNGTILAK